jgi:LuxR family transcriptional regulator
MLFQNIQSDLECFVEATSIEAVWERLLSRLQSFGFSNVLYGYTRFHSAYGFGDKEDNLILTNLGKDYVQGYFHEGRYRYGPIVKWAIKNQGACSWSYIADVYDDLSPEEKEVVEFNNKFGLRHGYTIGFYNNTKRYKGGIGISLEPFSGSQKDADDIWEEHGKIINILCSVAHLKIISLPFEERRLTSRQREALEWVGDGKTNSEVAIIMNLTLPTIEKHLKLARVALDVDTTAQAVLKASLHNQIYTL